LCVRQWTALWETGTTSRVEKKGSFGVKTVEMRRFSRID
jgi:hypothetical protein